MAAQTDMDSDLLFELYAHLQDLLKYHQEIDKSLKDLALRDSPLPHDFEPIENASSAIIDTCEKLENHFSPRSVLGGAAARHE